MAVNSPKTETETETETEKTKTEKTERAKAGNKKPLTGQRLAGCPDVETSGIRRWCLFQIFVWQANVLLGNHLATVFAVQVITQF
jgi:hypothetical protein